MYILLRPIYCAQIFIPKFFNCYKQSKMKFKNELKVLLAALAVTLAYSAPSSLGSTCSDLDPQCSILESWFSQNLRDGDADMNGERRDPGSTESYNFEAASSYASSESADSYRPPNRNGLPPVYKVSEMYEAPNAYHNPFSDPPRANTYMSSASSSSGALSSSSAPSAYSTSRYSRPIRPSHPPSTLSQQTIEKFQKLPTHEKSLRKEPIWTRQRGFFPKYDKWCRKHYNEIIEKHFQPHIDTLKGPNKPLQPHYRAKIHALEKSAEIRVMLSKVEQVKLGHVSIDSYVKVLDDMNLRWRDVLVVLNGMRKTGNVNLRLLALMEREIEKPYLIYAQWIKNVVRRLDNGKISGYQGMEELKDLLRVWAKTANEWIPFIRSQW